LKIFFSSGCVKIFFTQPLLFVPYNEFGEFYLLLPPPPPPLLAPPPLMLRPPPDDREEDMLDEDGRFDEE